MSGLDALLDSLPPRVLVGGKGGVGKTTCAAALAARSAARGTRTLLLSTDPAGSLEAAIRTPLSGEPRPVPGRPLLEAAQLDPTAARDAFLERWRDVLITILDRGTYLDRGQITGLVDASLPGLDETMALLTLLDLDREGWGRIVIDTPPTGHALRFLELPAAFHKVISLLDAMQEKHRFMVRALTHRYRTDAADLFLREMRERLQSFQRTLADAARFAVVLVARAEPLVVNETMRYVQALDRLALVPRAIIVNALPAAELTSDNRASLTALASIAPGVARFRAPLLDDPLIGMAGIERWGEAVGEGGAGREQAEGSRRQGSARGQGRGARDQGPSRSPLARGPWSLVPPPPASCFSLPHPLLPLSIIGGKGGVGKTSVACALGVAAAAPERPVLVVSTDPAPSVADALAQDVGEEIVAVAGAPGLFAQQLDASAAFARFRERFGGRVDALFDSLVRGSLDAAYDRRIARELLALAPPGVDEVYALSSLGETLAEGRFAMVIVDPAPTGHLLRLLALPALALDWSHRLLRLMLEYKELAGLGEAAEELLGFARRTRALSTLLRDQTRAGVLVVALDEPLVRLESERLIQRVGALDIGVLGCVWNRASAVPRPLSMACSSLQFVSGVYEPLRGVDALRQWVSGWDTLTLAEHE